MKLHRLLLPRSETSLRQYLDSSQLQQRHALGSHCGIKQKNSKISTNKSLHRALQCSDLFVATVSNADAVQWGEWNEQRAGGTRLWLAPGW